MPSKAALYLQSMHRLLEKLTKSWPFYPRTATVEMCYASGLPRTNPLIGRYVVSKKAFVSNKSTYVRHGDADAKELLYCARRELYEKAVEEGGNALASESWICTVKDRNGVFTVKIRYQGQAVISTQLDPHIPIMLDEALRYEGADGTERMSHIDGWQEGKLSGRNTWYPRQNTRSKRWSSNVLSRGW
ncbi:hypothetical protein FRC03_002889 [Tulasnella sp. 419]|nr:hypothetical protein FRC03_002889 [Tulasnella sp. 419]